MPAWVLVCRICLHADWPPLLCRHIKAWRTLLDNPSDPAPPLLPLPLLQHHQQSPLHFAAQRGSPELVNMLLQGNSGPMRNAQVGRFGGWGSLPWAPCLPQLASGWCSPALGKACTQPQLCTAVPLYLQDVRGTVPLYMAVMSGSVATVEVLLAAGARGEFPAVVIGLSGRAAGAVRGRS